jgi:streptogramin lyase
MGCANKIAKVELRNHESLTHIKVATGYVDAVSAVGSGDTVCVMISNGTLARIDAAKNTVVASIPIPTAKGKLLADAHAAWVDDGAAIWRVDAQTNEIKRLDFGVWFAKTLADP